MDRQSQRLREALSDSGTTGSRASSGESELETMTRKFVTGEVLSDKSLSGLSVSRVSVLNEVGNRYSGMVTLVGPKGELRISVTIIKDGDTAHFEISGEEMFRLRLAAGGASDSNP